MHLKLSFLCVTLATCISGPLLAAEPPDFGKLRLIEVERLVSERNRPLVASRRATMAAQASVDMAAGRPNPTVSLNTSGINTKHTASSGSLDTILRVDLPIERGGKRQLRLGVAGALLEGSIFDEADSLRQQRLLAFQAYFDLKATEEKERINSESARLAHQVLAKAELRLKAGDLSPADVARILTDTLRADSDASQAAVDHRRTRLVFAQLIAAEAEAPRIATSGPWPDLAPLPSEKATLETRPDVIAAQRRLDAAEKFVDLAKAQQTRDVTIGAQIERNNQNSDANLIGVGVSIPLFTGYDFRGEIHRAYVDRDSAKDELERIKALAIGESSQFIFEAERQSERARHLRDEALPAAHRANAAVQLAFNQGAASVLDVIDARRSLYAVEIDTTNALAEAAKARAAWAAATNRQELP